VPGDFLKRLQDARAALGPFFLRLNGMLTRRIPNDRRMPVVLLDLWIRSRGRRHQDYDRRRENADKRKD
jgi:hypothetical protein